MKGVVKRWFPRRNYGFIESDEIGNDIFVHRSEIDVESLREGQKVEFEVEDSPKGPRAKNLKVVE